MSTWQRLDVRMIWVDLAQCVLSLTPTALSIWVFKVEPEWTTLWPFALVAITGVLGAVADALRWAKTRYRITDELVEHRTGFFFKKYRSVRRELIRSVDASAHLRHRLTGMRILEVNVGEQNVAEPALKLDAVSKADAARLRGLLLEESPTGEPGEVLARIPYSWVVYNIFNIWAYAVAAGLLWGAYWSANNFGFDSEGFLRGVLDWAGRHVAGAILLVVFGIGTLGVGLMALTFLTENWNHRLVRVRTGNGSSLRTKKGLLKTREIDRDEARFRGVAIDEPLLWRWMGVSETSAISTGLTIWSLAPTSQILPRGPIEVARRVAAAALRVAVNPLTTPLRSHPPAALRRRLVRAVVTSGALIALAVWIGGRIGREWLVWIPIGWTPVAIALAVVGYRALGHAIEGRYIVIRSGAMSRSTIALQRTAVNGWVVRQSLLQRRLGLVTVTATTPAGRGGYEAPDADASEGLAFADRAVPGLLHPFLEREESATVAGEDRTDKTNAGARA